MKRLGLLLLALVGFFQSSYGQRTILPLGDSITEGGGHFTCYREFLPRKLEAAGLDFRLIGPKRDASSAHAGYSGKNTAYLASIIEEVYTHYPADLVLLHSGHNSFSKNLPVPGIVRDTDRIVRTILEINPYATILIAQVIPAGKLPKYDYIPELNEALAEYVERAPFKAQLVLVDQSDGFDWHTDTVEDSVHPNVAGAEKMATRWAEALSGLATKL